MGDERDERGDASEHVDARTAGIGFVVFASLLILAAEVYFNLHFPQPQARHLYPFLAALVLAVGAGLDRLRLLRLAVVVQVALSAAALPALVGTLRPEGWNASTTAERRVENSSSP